MLIRFIGAELKQPDKTIVEGQWYVNVPDSFIGSGLQLIDNEQTGAVDLESGVVSIKTGKSFRVSLAYVERGVSGKLYLTILEAKHQNLPKYRFVKRMRLTRVNDRTRPCSCIKFSCESRMTACFAMVSMH